MQLISKIAIGEQLKHWRLQRQTSQLDLAMLCESSTRHISFIETGRSHPGRDLLLKITEALNIPISSRRHILTSAGYAPIYRETGLNNTEMQQVKSLLENMIKRNDPYPSMLIDHDFNIVAHNISFMQMCELFIADKTFMREQPLNLLRLFLHPRGLGKAIKDYANVFFTMIARAQRVIDNDIGQNSLTDVLAELAKYYPLDDGPNAAEQPALIMPLVLENDQHRLSLSTIVTTLGTSLNMELQELMLECGLPTDEASEKLLKSFMRQH